MMNSEDAFDEIRRILEEERPTNWAIPDEFVRFAMEINRYPPDKALEKANAFIGNLRAKNLEQQKVLDEAEEYRNGLKEKPISNVGLGGIRGFFQRQFLALLNGTPGALNWLEVDDKGLEVYQPLATVSQRTINYQDIDEGRIVLSVDPPAYFDRIIGFLKQIGRDASTPWGEIILYEPGSGSNVARVVAMKPAKKVKEIEDALKQLHLVENPHIVYKRVPRLIDLLAYYDLGQYDEAAATMMG